MFKLKILKEPNKKEISMEWDSSNPKLFERSYFLEYPMDNLDELRLIELCIYVLVYLFIQLIFIVLT